LKCYSIGGCELLRGLAMLETVGLILAVIDITGMTPKIDELLTHVKDYLVNTSDRYKDGGPSKKYWTAGIVIIMAASLYQIIFNNSDKFHISSASEFGLALLALAFVSVFLCFAAGIIIAIVFVCFYYLLLYPLAAFFYILALPRRGIVATFGFLLAIIGFLLRSSH
jgi:hypothetical protein